MKTNSALAIITILLWTACTEALVSAQEVTWQGDSIRAYDGMPGQFTIDFTAKGYFQPGRLGLAKILRSGGGNVMLEFLTVTVPVPKATDEGELVVAPCTIDGQTASIPFRLEVFSAPLQGVFSGQPFAAGGNRRPYWGRAFCAVYGTTPPPIGNAPPLHVPTFYSVLTDWSIEVTPVGGATKTWIPLRAPNAPARLPRFDGPTPYLGQWRLRADNGDITGSVFLDIPDLTALKNGDKGIFPKGTGVTTGDSVVKRVQFSTHIRTDCTDDFEPEVSTHQVLWSVLLEENVGATPTQSTGSVTIAEPGALLIALPSDSLLIQAQDNDPGLTKGFIAGPNSIEDP